MHCECCGRENPSTDEDGYTSCCNEPVCDGWTGSGFRFGTEADNVRSCCWGKAEAIFAAEGREIPEGSQRLWPTWR